MDSSCRFAEIISRRLIGTDTHRFYFYWKFSQNEFRVFFLSLSMAMERKCHRLSTNPQTSIASFHRNLAPSCMVNWIRAQRHTASLTFNGFLAFTILHRSRCDGGWQRQSERLRAKKRPSGMNAVQRAICWTVDFILSLLAAMPWRQSVIWYYSIAFRHVHKNWIDSDKVTHPCDGACAPGIPCMPISVRVSANGPSPTSIAGRTSGYRFSSR